MEEMSLTYYRKPADGPIKIALYLLKTKCDYVLQEVSDVAV